MCLTYLRVAIRLCKMRHSPDQCPGKGSSFAWGIQIREDDERELISFASRRHCWSQYDAASNAQCASLVIFVENPIVVHTDINVASSLSKPIGIIDCHHLFLMLVLV